MQPDRVMVSTHRRSDGLCTKPYGLNTITVQTAGTNNAPQLPATQPCYMESWPFRGHATSTSTFPTSSPPSQLPQAHRHVKSPPIVAFDLPPQSPSPTLEVSLVIIYNSIILAVSVLIWLTVSELIRLTILDLIIINFFWFDSTHV